MTLRPDDDLPPGHGTGHSLDEQVQLESGTATEGVADAAQPIDEDHAQQANRTDVEGSPTGHS